MNRYNQIAVYGLLAFALGLAGVHAGVTYEYDRLHRLTRVTYQSGHAITYVYDAVGNRTRIESFRRGDVNGDGSFNVSDIDTFVAVLLGEDTIPVHITASDFDSSGVVDGNDAQPFVTALLGA